MFSTKLLMEETINISEFADKLICQYCYKTYGTKSWPVNGDIVPFYMPGYYYNADHGFAVVVDTTNIKVKFGADGNILVLVDNSSGASASVSNTDWNIIFKAII